ncbi:hypothetical protein XENOCAPTIV_004898, partial [Xenoophorus captivus]
LTVETDTEQPLPPPKEVARKLRSLAIQTVQSWQTSYGSAYKKLELGYHFLKQVKKFGPGCFLPLVLHVKETEDNEPVVSTMMELHRLISTKHLPAVQGWVQVSTHTAPCCVFTKSHAEPQLLRRALSLKKSLEAALHKHEELHIDCKTRVRKVAQSVITATGKHGMKVLKIRTSG